MLQQYERDTWYDGRGEIVFSNNRSFSDVGLERKQFQEVRHTGSADQLPDWAVEYLPPFDRCTRETDLAAAYKDFRARHLTGLPAQPSALSSLAVEDETGTPETRV